MKIVALTGSIGMGKSTTAAMFAALGVPVWDADQAVHRLYGAHGEAAAALRNVFPEAVDENGVNRDVLAGLVLNNPAALRQVEGLVHPLVGQDRSAFLAQARANGAQLVLVDVPLLFETGGEQFVDAVIVVSCGPELQRQRVMARPGMSKEKFEAILARQVPDAIKRDKADFIITTDSGLDDARKQVGKIHHMLMQSLPTGQEE
jgi:dephospho-CoA kinase